ncbi:hypothetical protein PFISCL1PPCAC_21232, partial [Pristionchus fissidentatus]
VATKRRCDVDGKSSSFLSASNTGFIRWKIENIYRFHNRKCSHPTVVGGLQWKLLAMIEADATGNDMLIVYLCSPSNR